MRALSRAIALLLALAPSAEAAVYHVSPSGSDAADGSMATPWQTLGHCAAMVQPGDTCQAHAGTYRETVTPPRAGNAAAPIRFEAAPGECAIVSGADVVGTSWQVASGSVYTTSATGPVTQLFANGALVNEARWPNADPTDLVHMPLASAGAGTDQNGLVATGAPAGDFTGAIVFLIPGARWWSFTRHVTAYDPVTKKITFDSPVSDGEGAPVQGTPYYLFGVNAALDGAGEWYLDTGAQQLYLWAPGSVDPTTLTIESKQRTWAFDVSNVDYIQIAGFQTFAAAIRLNNANHCTVDGVTGRFVAQLRETAGGGGTPAPELPTIIGNFNVWKNSVITGSASAGLVLRGTDNVIENNIIHDVNYFATNEAAIDIDSNWFANLRNLIAFNTVSRAGRAGIMLIGAQQSRVLFNRISDVNLMTNDMGGIDAYGTDGQGTEIAWNEIFNLPDTYGAGVYLDDMARNFIVHHNYLHDILWYGVQLKETNAVFSNTIRATGHAALNIATHPDGSWGSMSGALVADNVHDGRTDMLFAVEPSTVTDYGDYQATFAAGESWQHVVMPFSMLAQPGWAKPAAFDLAHVVSFSFSPTALGDYDVEIDNVQLEGATPRLVSDFESGLKSGFATSWAAYAGQGTTTTAAQVPIDAACAGHAARFNGTTIVGGFVNMVLNLSNVANGTADLSSYTGISFDIRARSRAWLVGQNGTQSIAPVQADNPGCPDDVTGVPTTSCALGQGIAIAPYTTGTTPDVGAFPSGGAVWIAGARFSEAAPGTCTAPADVQDTLPAAGSYPTTPATVPATPPLIAWDVTCDPGTGSADGGIPDGGTTDDAGAPGGPSGGMPPNGAKSGGCAMAGAPGSVTAPVLLLLALALLLRRRA